MKTVIIVILALGASIHLIAQNKHQKVQNRIEALLAKEVKRKEIRNGYLSVYSPSKTIDWHFAKGEFSDGTSVNLENPFYTASVGKTFTAVAIGMLVDKGKIRFNNPITDYLPKEIMVGLHVLNGIDYGDSILISHLLQHTSGIPDYFGEPTHDGTPSMLYRLVAEPNSNWTPEELVAFSKTHFKPAFAPGSDYAYTDTEYILLGLIIEKVSGMALHEFFAQNIFNPLQMENTYVNLRSKPNSPTPKMAEMFLSDNELSQNQSLSADWAGGAVVSTGKDLNKFHEALRNGKLVSASTFNTMQQWVPEGKGMVYGYGLRKINTKALSPMLPNWDLIGHSGINGTSMYYCPQLDVYFSSTLNQLTANKKAIMLMVKVLMQCKGIE